MKRIVHNADILIADDDDQVIDILRFMLEREGFNIRIATDGKQFKAALDDQPAPDLVLLDVVMPYTDGFELIGKVRTHPRWSSVPVVVLTSRSREQDIVQALEAGATEYITKPFQPAELITRIRMLIKDEGEPGVRVLVAGHE